MIANKIINLMNYLHVRERELKKDPSLESNFHKFRISTFPPILIFITKDVTKRHSSRKVLFKLTPNAISSPNVVHPAPPLPDHSTPTCYVTKQLYRAHVIVAYN